MLVLFMPMRDGCEVRADGVALAFASSAGRTWCAATGCRRRVTAHSSRTSHSISRAVRCAPKSVPRSAGVDASPRISNARAPWRPASARKQFERQVRIARAQCCEELRAIAAGEVAAGQRRGARPRRLHRREERRELGERRLGELAVRGDLAAEDRQQRRLHRLAAGARASARSRASPPTDRPRRRRRAGARRCSVHTMSACAQRRGEIGVDELQQVVDFVVGICGSA